VSSGTSVQPAVLPDDRATLDGVSEDRRTFDCRRGRLHSGQRDRDGDDNQYADGGV
jgi:hypothetical protein